MYARRDVCPLMNLKRAKVSVLFGSVFAFCVFICLVSARLKGDQAATQ